MRRRLVVLALCGTVIAPLATEPVPRRETAVLAGGCFWGIEAVYEHVRGVIEVTSGYAGGSAETASYRLVGTGTTGHAESVRIVFDPDVVSYATLLDVFFAVHDPTELNRQGPDVGPEYRSAIFFAGQAQRRTADSVIAALTRARVYREPIVTQVVPFSGFFEAEDYHQNYASLHPTQPYIVYNDLPKLDRLRRQFPQLWRDTTAAALGASAR